MMKKKLDALYRRYNRREFVSPDPIEFLYEYRDSRDREIAGLVSSSLAYGRVSQILKSVRSVLSEMGSSPRRFLTNASPSGLRKKFAGFKHRFTGCDEITGLLVGARSAVAKFGSLNECFLAGHSSSSDTVLPAILNFARTLREATGSGECQLLPDPEKGSACKRLNLYLRWMVRKDAVDPGGWRGVARRQLIIPLDTHMARIGRMLEATRRAGSDIKTALEITAFFRKLEPEDPVKYDFVLTRFGIRKELEPKMLAAELKQINEKGDDD